MNEFPDDWFRGGPPGGSAPPPGAGDPTVRVPGGRPGAAAPIGQAGAGASGHDAPTAAWPEQPPAHNQAPPRSRADGWGAAAAGAPPRSPRSLGGGGARRWLRPRRITMIVALVIALVLIFTVGMYFFLDSKLHRQDVLVNYSGRPAAAAGTNWLIAGSDSRQGLTARQERRLATGFDISGGRSDTVMVLHIPSGGPPLLVSLPRDSYVDIPGHGYNKLNAAYSLGGPKLLAKTVQNITGLRIEHYMGIGFGGFVHVVNDIGGVRMCFTTNLNDPASGLHLKKGCHILYGAQALGFVRSRHLFADQDLQRIRDQRLFLKALLTKMTSPGVMLNPFDSIPAATGVAGTLTVDQGTSLYQLIEVAFALRHPETTTVPIANPNYVTPAGDSVEWNTAEAKQLFSDLNNGQPVPRSLITGSQLAP